MKILLPREKFREQVFLRDGGKCVICGSIVQDAHHIIERRLFDNGGYYLDNGASLCGDCHIKAEQTLVSPEEIREKAGIVKKMLPEHLYPDYDYDKWGNIVYPNGLRIKGELFFDESVQKILKSGNVLDSFSDYTKYPRTYHLPCSPGRTEDDKTLQDYSIFEGKKVVATVKMDGENTSGYWNGYIHARSIDSNNHASRNWVKNYLAGILYNLPQGWRICGENVYAKHAIHYSNLESYFYLFSIWDDKNNCLSWEETKEWADLLGLQVVPTLYEGDFDQSNVENLFLPTYRGNPCEGFVLRTTESFSYGNFRKSAAKFVRANHVEENKHWIKTKIIPNRLSEKKLIDFCREIC